VNDTIEDTGGHAYSKSLWPIDMDEWVTDDLGYGRHAIKSTSHRIPPECELTVDDILNRTDGWLRIGEQNSRLSEYADQRQGTPASAIVARLMNERKAELLDEHEARYPTVDKAPITEVMQVAPPFWDTSTPEGILLQPRYPAGPPKREMHDPDATVGFIPVREVPPAPPVTEGGNGPDERAYWDDGDPEPLDHTRVEYDKDPVGQETQAWRDYMNDTRFDPIDTRVKKVPLWKQAFYGWFPPKDKKRE
jgi:hypothetical protein